MFPGTRSVARTVRMQWPLSSRSASIVPVGGGGICGEESEPGERAGGSCAPGDVGEKSTFAIPLASAAPGLGSVESAVNCGFGL